MFSAAPTVGQRAARPKPAPGSVPDGCEPIGGLKQRVLLTMLLIRTHEVVSSDRLIRGLWDELPETARTALQGRVLCLRKLLGRERLLTRPPAAGTYVTV
jgi:DNA-binding SARP family transcriptional activator